MRIRSLAINSFRLVASAGMPTVLIIGIDPLAVPGPDGAAVRAALDQELARFGDHAIDASMLLIALDESAGSAMASALSRRAWDGGDRLQHQRRRQR